MSSKGAARSVVAPRPRKEGIVAAVIERAELHKTIWRIANDLRGSVDGWDFKSLSIFLCMGVRGRG